MFFLYIRENISLNIVTKNETIYGCLVHCILLTINWSLYFTVNIRTLKILIFEVKIGKGNV